MKKNVKKLNIWLFAIIAGVSMTAMTSCSDDDDNGDKTNDGKVDPSTIAADNLIAYFPFEDNGNDVVGGLSPASTTGVSYVGGANAIRGKAFQGNGELGSNPEGGDAISGDLSFLHYTLPAGSKLKDLKAFSFSMWVKCAATTKGGPEPMIFQIDGTGDWTWGNLFFLQHRLDPATTDSTEMTTYFWKDDITPPDGAFRGQRANPKLGNFFGKWMHIISTYDNTTSKYVLYIGGVKFDGGAGLEDRKQREDGDPLGDLKFVEATTLTIGAWADVAKGKEKDWQWAGSFKGNIDEFRIYDRALTADEAKQLFDAEFTQLNEE
jgi:hypothetical protein